MSPEGLSAFTSLAVGIILFEGGLTLRLSDIAGHGRAVTRLISLGAVITWVLAAISAHFIVGLGWGVAALFGALVIVTGPTVIAPLLQNIRPNPKVAGVLRWEGILIDPVGALAAAIAFEWVRSSSGEALSATLTHVAGFVGAGLATGLLLGGLLAWALRRERLPDHLVNPTVLAAALLAFGLSDALAPESGLLSTTVMGMLLANAKVPRTEELLHFKEELVVVLLSTIFVALAANVPTQALLNVFTPGPLLLLAALIVLVRPLSVLISTHGSGLTLRERLFISYVGPRGIVAAAVSALFASRLAEEGVPGADQLLTLVFAVIVGTVVLASLTAKPVAKALGVAQADPTGYLILGAHPLARHLAGFLKAEGTDVVLADTNAANIAQARAEGLAGYHGSLLSDAADSLPLEGLGTLLALTPNDEVNALTAQKYARIFGRQQVYQLAAGGAGRTQLQEAQMAQPAFVGAPPFNQLQALWDAGARLERTEVGTPQQLSDYLAALPPGAVPLLLDQAGLFKPLRELPASALPGSILLTLVPRSGKAA
ncbi:cation:proton antiporter [Deinococcus lacus]|uniref:Cation:proton antiporter n=1 Tax=Deinococcus lacus TaxID=392561 RepID=A0ABW1YBH5_9DEIO